MPDLIFLGNIAVALHRVPGGIVTCPGLGGVVRCLRCCLSSLSRGHMCGHWQGGRAQQGAATPPHRRRGVDLAAACGRATPQEKEAQEKEAQERQGEPAARTPRGQGQEGSRRARKTLRQLDPAGVERWREMLSCPPHPQGVWLTAAAPPCRSLLVGPQKKQRSAGPRGGGAAADQDPPVVPALGDLAAMDDMASSNAALAVAGPPTPVRCPGS
jgi:hypothetical protein